jgi:FAD:protein FMN transferase
MSAIHVFNHHAMATEFQVRIADDDAAYAAQAARTAFDTADRLESFLSRFRENSEISQLARLAAGEKLRLSEPTLACLTIAREMELATRGAFSPTPATRSGLDQWALIPSEFSIQSISGDLEFDLGAVGKGFGLPVFSIGRGRQQHSRGRGAARLARLVHRARRQHRRPPLSTGSLLAQRIRRRGQRFSYH